MESNDPSPKTQNLFTKLIENYFVPTALFSVVGYYFGWNAASAYYIVLGLTPSLLKKSPQEYWSIAWVEILFFAILLIISYILNIYVGNYFKHRKPGNAYFWVFHFLLVFSIIGITYYGIQTTVNRNSDTYLQSISTLLFVFSFFLLIITTSIGKSLQDQEISLPENFIKRVFKIVFPNCYIYLVIIIIGLVFAIGRVAIIRGHIIAQNDSNQSSRLPKVVLYSAKPLPLDGLFDSNRNLFVYKDYLLIDVNEENLFILQNNVPLTDKVGFNTFIIPRNNEIFIMTTP
jgi:hypothetical protein